MAFLLVASNMAFSDHLSTHTQTDFGACSYCFHQGGSDNAVTPPASVFFANPPHFKIKPEPGSPPYLQIASHDHQSRAPPRFA